MMRIDAHFWSPAHSHELSEDDLWKIIDIVKEENLFRSPVLYFCCDCLEPIADNDRRCRCSLCTKQWHLRCIPASPDDIHHPFHSYHPLKLLIDVPPHNSKRECDACQEELQSYFYHSDDDARLTLAHQLYKAGDFKQALEHSNLVYQRNPLRTDNLLLIGAIYYQLQDYDMCIARNEEALRIQPQFAECYGNMANAWKEKGDTDRAIRYYLIAIELKPNYADAWSNLASAYMRKGRLSEATQCCQQALSLNPLLVDAHSNLGNLMKAQGLIQEAYSCYLEAVRIQPTFAIAWSNLAGLFMDLCLLCNMHISTQRSLSISLTATLSMITSRKIRMCWIQSLSPRDLTMDFLKINSYLDALTNYTKWILRSSILDAAAQGVHPDQIIFTDVAMKNEHIRRSVLADVILDTPLCNGHTTGTDVLWAGVPMITLPLEKMATRVAGSLCLATGLGHEMIVNSLEEYEEKAVSLALNKPKLQALTKELRASRLTCPLFDTMRWVKNLERSYFKMWNLHCSGQKPQHFKVVENDMEFPHDR
ncbi:hypothetical protein F2Q68_00033222 [Brassica cretica]|uniref:protein O-GlcNAc transferase n=1 Tax=Brassica cretica TaxID=69181 RepID=A0A8S9G8K6_BRACR|nr:hypothetical protein F2Q68_00033222 [Brassica cretica]